MHVHDLSWEFMLAFLLCECNFAFGHAKAHLRSIVQMHVRGFIVRSTFAFYHANARLSEIVRMHVGVLSCKCTLAFYRANAR